jgi:hypothetical protein
MDELSGLTTGKLGYVRPDSAHAIRGTAELALKMARGSVQVDEPVLVLSLEQLMRTSTNVGKVCEDVVKATVARLG